MVRARFRSLGPGPSVNGDVAMIHLRAAAAVLTAGCLLFFAPAVSRAAPADDRTAICAQTAVAPTWSSSEAWAWHAICETAHADLANRPRSQRVLSGRFLQQILFSSPYSEELPVEGVHIDHAQITGSVSFAHHSCSRSLSIENSHFTDAVDLSSFATSSSLSFDGSTFAGPLRMRALRAGDVMMRSGTFTSIDLMEADISGALKLDDSAVKTILSLAEARISKDFTMDRIGARRTVGSLDMPGVEIGGKLSMRGIVVTVRFDMSNGSVAHRADFDFGEFPLANNQVSSLSEAHVGGRLLLPDLAGNLDLHGASVGGNLHVTHGNYNALDLSSAAVSGEVLFEKHTFIDRVTMYELKVDRDLKLEDTHVVKADIRNGTIGGSLRLNGSSFDDSLIVAQETIGGNLEVYNDVLPSGSTTLFENMAVAGNVEISGGELGSVDLTGTKSSGDLLLGSYADITWNPGAKLTLRNATVRAVEDRTAKCPTPKPSCTPWPDRISLSGFTYQTFGSRDLVVRKHLAADIALRKSDQWEQIWLSHDAGDSFDPQPYDELAAVLRQLGQIQTANEILIKRMDKERDQDFSERNFAGVVGLQLHKGFVGYGYEVWRAVVLTLVLILFGFVVLQRSEVSRRLGQWGTLVYSFDMLLPVVRLDEKNYKQKIPESGIRYYFYVHKLLGWVLASFLVAALSGLAK